MQYDYPLDIIHVEERTNHNNTPEITVHLRDSSREDERTFRVSFRRIEEISVGVTITDNTSLSGPYWDLSGWGGPGDTKTQHAAIGVAIQYLTRTLKKNVLERASGSRGFGDAEPDYVCNYSPTGDKIHLFAKRDNTSLCGAVDLLSPTPLEETDFDQHRYRFCVNCSSIYDDREADDGEGD